MAALTDHDTLDGQVKFRDLLKARGIGFISGVEITTSTSRGELHILAYGFDLESENLKQLLVGAPEERTLEKTLEVVHQSGGKAFLAHPLVISEDRTEVESVVEELARQGLDGIEAFYTPYPVEDQERLLELADRSNLWPKRAVWANAHLLLAELRPERASDQRRKAWSIDARTAASRS